MHEPNINNPLLLLIIPAVIMYVCSFLIISINQSINLKAENDVYRGNTEIKREKLTMWVLRWLISLIRALHALPVCLREGGCWALTIILNRFADSCLRWSSSKWFTAWRTVRRHSNLSSASTSQFAVFSLEVHFQDLLEQMVFNSKPQYRLSLHDKCSVCNWLLYV